MIVPAVGSIRDIAKSLERATSTVSREVAGHGGGPAYRAHERHGQMWEWALRPKPRLLGKGQFTMAVRLVGGATVADDMGPM